MDRVASWFREIARMFLLYLAAATAAIPFGMVYAFLVLKGWDHWVAIAALLGSGTLSAHFVWASLDKRTGAKRSTEALKAAPQQTEGLSVAPRLMELSTLSFTTPQEYQYGLLTYSDISNQIVSVREVSGEFNNFTMPVTMCFRTDATLDQQLGTCISLDQAENAIWITDTQFDVPIPPRPNTAAATETLALAA